MESKGRAPSFQFYPDRALADTDHLSPIPFKAYWQFIWWLWRNTKTHFSVENDSDLIRRVTKLTPAKFRKFWMGEIMRPGMEMLRVEGKMLVSNALRKEWIKQKKRHDDAVANANKRWGRCQNDAPALPEHMPPQCSPSPSTSPSLSLSPIDSPRKDTAMGDCGFSLFWNAYGRKVKRKKVLAIWRQMKPDKDLLAKILEAIAQQKKTVDWKDGFQPHPTTWLNQERWNDDISAYRKPSGTRGQSIEEAAAEMRGETK